MREQKMQALKGHKSAEEALPNKEKSRVIRLLAILIAAIFAVEYSIMIYLFFFGVRMSDFTVGFIDSLLLVLIVFPVLYTMSYRPLLLQINERMRFESGRKRCSLE